MYVTRILLPLVPVFFLAFAAAAQGADPLADWGITPTTGAAAGYVPDAACAECHADKAESFAEMGMAKSFYRPAPDKVIEDFTAPPFFHEPSGRYYHMALGEGGEYRFTRYRLAPDGTKVDEWTRKVDWILGSGHHSRVYLYRTDDGQMFELPLAWYSQSGTWNMAPGYEFADHPGVLRQVHRRCMGCHNAFPEVPEGADRVGAPDTFPADLPQGIGCQRCHGPGADHVRAALGPGATPQGVRAAITNPAKLPRDLTYSVCYGCHMQPTVAVNAQLRLVRTEYSFRPGQDVADFLAHVDIVDGKRAPDERFEINHHPYRLEQSACFTASEGQLGCLTCHDPHVKIEPAERAAHYRAACLTCHSLDAEAQPEPVSEGGTHPRIGAEADCTTCHMPARRTQDVIHVTMTDHRITRDPGPLAALTAPLQNIPADVTEVRLYDPAPMPEDEALIYKVLAIFSHTGRAADYAADALEAALARLDPPHVAPWLELGLARLKTRRFADAEAPLRRALALDPENPRAASGLAIALFRMGRTDAAIATLDANLRLWPDLPDHHHNRAVMLAAQGRMEEALRAARRAVALRDTHWGALRLIAELEAQRGNEAEAITAYLAALAVQPSAPRIRAPLANLLTAAGRDEEAARHAAEP